ncbi:hypothetical protein G7Y89_g687 [Cudoniella acicularis]|uniref:Protein kinase domain-containing protein n=1 Tax=Cudoniella acicularis TaxID=354080 RepID=A0A8H4RXP0_9HELO|nr:hypothetical protein G7Y89_g687 [Cudoniella acicularis]
METKSRASRTARDLKATSTASAVTSTNRGPTSAMVFGARSLADQKNIEVATYTNMEVSGGRAGESSNIGRTMRNSRDDGKDRSKVIESNDAHKHENRLDLANPTSLGGGAVVNLQVEGTRRDDSNAYWPVKPGQLYHSRYCIIQNIGNNIDGTEVWMAADTQWGGRHVVLKLLDREHKHELALHKRLGASTVWKNWAGRQYLLPILDSFETGYKYPCAVLVSPLLVPFETMNEDLKQKLRLNIKGLLLQLAQAVAFLHANGITHAANDSMRSTLERYGYKVDKPETNPDVPTFHVPIPYAKIRLMDLGQSYIDPPPYLPTGRDLELSPELVADGLATHAIADVGGFPVDMWALGVTMYKIAFKGPDLFDYNPLSESETFLCEVEDKIGSLPKSWNLPNLKPRNPNYYRYPYPELFWAGLSAKYRGSWSWREVEGFLGLVRKMLKVDPLERATIDEIVEDPWFKNVKL